VLLRGLVRDLELARVQALHLVVVSVPIAGIAMLVRRVLVWAKQLLVAQHVEFRGLRVGRS
jgi:hypothetical protein